jgi:hypothetical protein
MGQMRKIYRKNSGGVFVPDGVASDWSSKYTETYLDVKEKACEVEALYSDSGVAIPCTCDLANQISDVKKLSDSWLTKIPNEIPLNLLFRTLGFQRIADAVLPLQTVDDNRPYLKALTSGTLDFFKRKKSRAKDILWELELWALLNRRGFNAVLSEPDIVINFEDSKIAIPCKKIYSERGTQKVLSNAVGQVERSFDYGIAALNIDDLTPENSVCRGGDYGVVGSYISQLNMSFIKRNERHFRKYLSNGRLLSAMVSTSSVSDLTEEKTRLHNVRQTSGWIIPGLPKDKADQVKRFHSKLMG